MSDWDNLVEPTRAALEALIRKGDAQADRIEELEAVLREVAAWVDDLGLYAQEGHEPVAVFKRVKEVLNK